MSWKSLRPIFNRLPAIYREGDESTNVANLVTGFWDDFVVEIKQKVSNFSSYLDPDTAPSDWLDWLAQLCGFTDNYWSTEWDDSVKRQLIRDSYTLIWTQRGTKEGVSYWFDQFNLPTYTHDQPGSIYQVPDWEAGISLVPAPINGKSYRWYLRLFENVERGDSDWNLAQRFLDNNSPAWGDSSLGFRYYLANRSALGEGVFDYLWEQTLAPATLYLEHNQKDCLALTLWLSQSLGLNVEASEIPVWRAGITEVAGLVYPAGYMFFKVPNSEVLFGSETQAWVKRLADIYCGSQALPLVCYERFYAGLSRCDQPIFDDGNIEREVTIEVNDGVPSPVYTEPSLDYFSKPVFEALRDWLDAGKSPSECLALFAYVIDALGIPVSVVEIPGEFECGITPVSGWVGGSRSVLFRFDNSASWIDDPAWAAVQNLISWLCRYGHIEGLGYEGFYAGISPTYNPIYVADSPQVEYERTVALDGFNATYTDPSNPNNYDNRDVYDLLVAWFDANPQDVALGATQLGRTQWVLDQLGSPFEGFDLPLFKVGDAIAPAWVSDHTNLYLKPNANSPGDVTVTPGSPDWDEAERIADLTARRGYRLSELWVYVVGESSVDHPVFEENAPVRTVSFSIAGEPVPTYEGLEFDYAYQEAYEAAYGVLGGDDAIIDLTTFFTALFAALSVVGDVWLTPDPTRPGVDCLSVAVDFPGASSADTSDWDYAEQVVLRFNQSLNVFGGYDSYYAGFSPVSNRIV